MSATEQKKIIFLQWLIANEYNWAQLSKNKLKDFRKITWIILCSIALWVQN